MGVRNYSLITQLLYPAASVLKAFKKINKTPHYLLPAPKHLIRSIMLFKANTFILTSPQEESGWTGFWGCPGEGPWGGHIRASLGEQTAALQGTPLRVPAKEPPSLTPTSPGSQERPQDPGLVNQWTRPPTPTLSHCD